MNPKDSVEQAYGWVVVFASLALHAIGMGVVHIVIVGLKPIAVDLGVARAVPSTVYSLLMLGAGIGGIFFGHWTDRSGVFRPVLFGAVMIALGSFAASQANGEWMLYIANGVLIGMMGKAAMIGPLVANVTRWFDRRRGLAISMVASAQGVSGALWPPVARYLIETHGWRTTYKLFGLFALATMIPLAFVLRRQPPKEPAAAGARRLDTTQSLGLEPRTVQAVLWLATVCCCVAMAVPTVHLVSHATDLGFSTVRAAELLSVLMAAGFLSRIVFGFTADRIGGLKTLLIGSIGQALAILIFPAMEQLWALYLAALIFGLSFSGIMPCYALIVRMFFPVQGSGWRIASIYMFASIGMAIGGWMGGVLFDLTGTYTAAFLVAFAVNVLNTALAGALLWRYSRPRLRLTEAPAE
ncbi:MAG: MFS transporter [Alphaproteobacteria bacterium]|nr:MFS transporter [Alphaproteobacteria bacterium]